jgi:spermidine/putrescine transport system ATP-binding protein
MKSGGVAAFAVTRPAPDHVRMADREGSRAEIVLSSLTKRYGDVCAVDDVSLEIAHGEFFSLLGPSGCGKTTTLRMIGGFESPTSGTVEVAGRDVTRDPPERRPVNMVFQSYALFPHLNVFDNVAFGLRRSHTPRDEVRERVGAVLALVRMEGYDRRRPDQLSGGQQQRIALARALVNRPTVLLLDEPLGALDLKLRKQLQLELKRIQQEVGITFVYVTHDQEEALTLSDRIAVMRAGKVEQLGTPEALYDSPSTRFVADFIGTTNLLAGVVEAVGDGDAMIVLEGGERCHAIAGTLAAGAAVDVSVRPEVIEIVGRGGEAAGMPVAFPVGDGPAGSTLDGTVEQVAYLGTSVSYIVRTRGGVAVAALVPRSAGRFPMGAEVTVGWRRADALVLTRAVVEEEARP